MNMETVKLIDPSRKIVAVGQVADEGKHFGGTIDLRDTPAHVRALFDEFEEIVNGQMFSFLDEVQEKIRALAITVKFDSGREVRVGDLQVFPSTGDFSFTFAEIPARSAKLA